MKEVRGEHVTVPVTSVVHLNNLITIMVHVDLGRLRGD